MIVQLASLILAHSAAAVAPPMPPPGPEVAHAPQPHGTAASLFSVDDYPAKAVGTGAHGKVVARLTIDKSGRVAACSIVHSSGYSELDVATCNILRRRARYGPAVDRHGVPVVATVDEAITWVAP